MCDTLAESNSVMYFNKYVCHFTVGEMRIVDLGYDDLFYHHLIMLMQELIIGLLKHLKHHITEHFESVYALAFSLKVHCISSLHMTDTFHLLTYRIHHTSAERMTMTKYSTRVTDYNVISTK